MFLLVTQRNYYFSHLHAGAGSEQRWLQTVGLRPSFPRSRCVFMQGRPKAPPATQNASQKCVPSSGGKKSWGAKVKFDQLIIRKIIKTVANRCHNCHNLPQIIRHFNLRLKCIKLHFGYPTGGAHRAPPDHFVISKSSAARRLTDILQCGPHPQMSLRPRH